MKGGPAAIVLSSLGLALLASPDVPWPRPGPLLAGLAALLVITLVATLLERRAPRRLVAVGAATLAAALGYDALRAEHGAMALVAGQPASAFERVEGHGRTSTRPLGGTVVLQSVAPDGGAVLSVAGTEEPVHVFPRRAASVAGYRLAEPRPLGVLAANVPSAVTLSVIREPAALLAGLGVLIAAIGVAWSRW